ncbi:MAG: sterol desaturase family protein [Myxococcota bacterium]
MNLIAMAIPVFFLLIGVEVLVARWRGAPVYRFSDSIADLGCGIVQQIVSGLRKGLVIALYIFLYEFRLADIPYAWWGWLIAFLGVDFAYYWFHRLSHEINFMWAAHVVHHQSEEYNLTVALRQSAFQGFFSFWFYMPLALVGVPPLMFGTMAALNTLYQFWIHTRLIGRMGWLEHIINTPSHHRVHHGQNPKYIDKNHAGSLIIWDKMFGTFQAEEEEPIYGVTEPVSSWNVLWANVHVWVDSWHRFKAATTMSDKLKVWFGKPGFIPPSLPQKTEWIEFPKYDPPARRPVVYYVLGQFIAVVVATVVYLFKGHEMTTPEFLGLGFMVIATMAALGALLDGRRWAFGAEVLRSVAAMIGLAILVPASSTPGLAFGLVLVFVAWIIALSRIRPHAGASA